MTDEGFLRELLAHPGDKVTRLVYADWLDERDDPRGEFLRLEVRLSELEPDTAEHAAVGALLQQMRSTLDPDWLARFDQTCIENCTVSFRFECPMRWEQLQPTEDQRVRFCDKCLKHVHHCQDVAEAREHAAMAHCVAIDSRCVRHDGDFEDDFSEVGALDDDAYSNEDGMMLGLLEPDSVQEPLESKRRWWQFWKR
jgi:uncharacterized protein (TIGR02996 family)